MKALSMYVWSLLVIMMMGFTSCGDDDEALEVDEVWKVQNEEAFQAQMLVPGFEQLSSQSNAGFILYKVLKTGESKEPIYYTSKVECLSLIHISEPTRP